MPLLSQEVFVVTGFELGWDNVVGVFANIPYEELLERFPEDLYYINVHWVETPADIE